MSIHHATHHNFEFWFKFFLTLNCNCYLLSLMLTAKVTQNKFLCTIYITQNSQKTFALSLSPLPSWFLLWCLLDFVHHSSDEVVSSSFLIVFPLVKLQLTAVLKMRWLKPVNICFLPTYALAKMAMEGYILSVTFLIWWAIPIGDSPTFSFFYLRYSFWFHFTRKFGKYPMYVFT